MYNSIANFFYVIKVVIMMMIIILKVILKRFNDEYPGNCGGRGNPTHYVRVKVRLKNVLHDFAENNDDKISSYSSSSSSSRSLGSSS